MSFVAVGISSVSALGQINAGNLAKGKANLQADQMDYQAKVEKDNALETARIIRRAGARSVGQATAAYAGAGVKVGEGSAGEVEQQLRQDVEHDAFQSILEGDRRGRGMETNAAMTRIQGGMAQTAGYVNAVGTVLSGGYKAMTSNGWRSNGPGFSGTQAPAPVETRTFRPVGGY